MATIGDRITEPETGWKRIDDTDENIIYEELDEFNKYPVNIPGWGCYNDTRHCTYVKDSYYKFYIYSSNIRIYGAMFYDNSVNKTKDIYVDNELITSISTYMNISDNS